MVDTLAYSTTELPISKQTLAYSTQPFTVPDIPAQHHLTIPGEMLAEACEIGQVMFAQTDDGYWEAAVVLNCAKGKTYIFGNGKSPAEALQAAIAKSWETGK